MNKVLSYKIPLFAVFLAFVVVLLGAWTRLSDAGLGCPDWPGCYGHITVPQSEQALEKAKELFPEKNVVAEKAWPEMIHRYFAGTLGLVVFYICFMLIKQKTKLGNLSYVAIGLGSLIIFQALLGMWTVTLGLWPLTVMGHLLGGFLTLNLLWYITLRLRDNDRDRIRHPMVKPLLLAMVVVFLQISLGGWTSSNYAAIICTDFPTCQGSWFPPMDFMSAYQLWGHGVDNYEFGILGNDARVTIQWMHRLGAYMTIGVVGWLVFKLWTSTEFKMFAKMIAAILTLQVALGISNVIFSIPMPIALMHNAVAALLLLSLVTTFHHIQLSDKGVLHE